MILVPSPGLYNIGMFDNKPLPFEAVFWKPDIVDGKLKGMARNRSPLFCHGLGIEPSNNVMVDTLHAFYFGPLERWLACVLWRIVQHNPWGIVACNKDARYALCCQQLRLNLDGWYLQKKCPTKTA